MPEVDLIAPWKSLWERAVAFEAKEKGGRPEMREPFQLLVAALYLQRRALDSFLTSGALHRHIRGAGETVGPGAVLAISPDSLVGCGDLLQVFGQVNLASASLRLPVALLETMEVNASTKALFQAARLLKYQRGQQPPGAIPIDFERAECANAISAVSALGCCSNGSPPGLTDAITILIAHRDDYGHGEVGRPRIAIATGTPVVGLHAWITRREGCLDSLYRCRLVQVQQHLIDLALAGLETAP